MYKFNFKFKIVFNEKPFDNHEKISSTRFFIFCPVIL